MSKDIIVLAPNGRRQKIHCTPDTSILQVLEDACQKQGFQPSDYDLKHHNHILDLTTTIRFSNLPNKATLEMVEADTKRVESNVTIGLQLEDGERRTADFAPTTTLYDLVITLAPSEIGAIQQPTISYMRQEVVGETALREKTLRQLGLIKGRAILRLLNKQEESRQANVSAVYRKSVAPKTMKDNKAQESTSKEVVNKNVRHHSPDFLTKLEEVHKSHKTENLIDQPVKPPVEPVQQDHLCEAMEIDENKSSSTSNVNKQEDLERRLKIDEEVIFIGSYKAIAFMQPETLDYEIDDLPDDFYDLTVEEVRRLYVDLQQNRLNLENTPLMIAAQKENQESQSSLQKLNLYKNVVVRIQFPDRIILQGVFTPANSIQHVINFIKEHLLNPNEKFQIFTTPLKETLDPTMTLLDARFVPCVHMHFKWLKDRVEEEPCLKPEIYSKLTAPDAARILASKYRAPRRREKADHNSTNKPSTSGGKVPPRWLVLLNNLKCQ